MATTAGCLEEEKFKHFIEEAVDKKIDSVGFYDVNETNQSSMVTLQTWIKTGLEIDCSGNRKEWDDLVDRLMELTRGLGCPLEVLKNTLMAFSGQDFREQVGDIITTSAEEWAHEVAKRL